MSDKLKNKFDSIIFDLDGTLWDSAPTVSLAWQATKNQVDFVHEDVTPDMVRSIMGLTYDEIFKKLFPYLTEEQRLIFQKLCSVLELDVLNEHGGDLYPQLEETLKYLVSKYKLFVVSNCQSGYIEIFLKTSKFSEYFSGYQCYGTKGQPKAENIKDIVKDHQLITPVYVGDTLGDYNSSTKAGVPFIFASYGFGKVETGQIATINQLGDLKELL